jgi:hypothetical protein
MVAVVLGPGTQREVISKLLEGSRQPIKPQAVMRTRWSESSLSPKTPGGGAVASASGSMETIPVAQMQTPPQRSTSAHHHLPAAGHRRRAAARRPPAAARQRTAAAAGDPRPPNWVEIGESDERWHSRTRTPPVLPRHCSIRDVGPRLPRPPALTCPSPGSLNIKRPQKPSDVCGCRN